MIKLIKPYIIIVLFLIINFWALPGDSIAGVQSVSTPFINIGLNTGSQDADTEELSVLLKVFLLLTILSLAPAILIMLTSFTRIVIVLSLLRQAMGTHQMPPNQIIIGLSLFLTMFVMTPVWQNINKEAIQPYLNKKITQEQALQAALKPVSKFMFAQTREKDLALFVDIAGAKRPETVDDISIAVLIPSFIISEMKTAFIIGFLLYIPFLVIDMVVACILLSMGMMMLPPIMISLPFKLMLFVLADGWYLIVGSLIKSFS